MENRLWRQEMKGDQVVITVAVIQARDGDGSVQGASNG